MSSQQPNKSQGLPNPYAQPRLPNPYAPPTNLYPHATVAEAPPVTFSEEQKAEQKKPPAFHNPHAINRPQPKKGAPKKPQMPIVSTTKSDSAPSSSTTQKPTYQDFLSTVEDDAAVLEEQRQRNKDDRQWKRDQKKFGKKYGEWNPDRVHTLSEKRFSNIVAYTQSGAHQQRLDGFNAFLKAAASSQQTQPRNRSEGHNTSRLASSDSSRTPPFAPKATSSDTQVVPTPPATIPNDQSGEDAYARRLRLSSGGAPVPPPTSDKQDTVPPPPPSGPATNIPPPPPPPSSGPATNVPPPPPPPPSGPTINVPPPPPPPPGLGPPSRSTPTTASPAYHSATISAPPVHYANATISGPPVRYEHPKHKIENDPTDHERPPKKPKKSIAENMMAKMGWVKGEGLGKNHEGITTHLEVKARKQVRGGPVNDFDDSVGKAPQIFDIRGGLSTRKNEPGKFGEESNVIVAWGCVDGINWEEDADRNDGGIRQEMGDTFDAKFGSIARIWINLVDDARTVYVKFNSPLSALNAVNRFDEGWEFRGRKIRALYYNEAKFDASIYDH